MAVFRHTSQGVTVRNFWLCNSNVFAVKTCSHESIVCPVVNLATYVKLAGLMNISLREGSLFRASDSKGQVSSKPFVGSAVANLLRLHLMIRTLNTVEGETMHGFRSGCSITLSLLGASDDQVAGKAYRRLNIYFKSRKLWTCCFLPLFLLRALLEGRMIFPLHNRCRPSFVFVIVSRDSLSNYLETLILTTPPPPPLPSIFIVELLRLGGI